MPSDRQMRTIRHIEDWAEWQRHYHPSIGYRKRSAGFDTLGGIVTDESAGQQQDAAEIQRCMIVDSCIDDLRPDSLRSAIYRRFLGAKYIGLRNYEQSLADAIDALEVAFLKKAILW